MKRVILPLLLVLGILVNTGIRHETALSPSEAAACYYQGDFAFSVLRELSGCDSEDPVELWSSPLCQRLRDLMRDTMEKVPSYGEALQAFYTTDISGDSSEPLLFYSDCTGDFNQEQVWPDARGNFFQEGAGQDLHHLRPENPMVNILRGSQTFGQVLGRFDSYEICGSEENPVLWYVSGWNGGAGLCQVRDEVKGDVARILLYVFTCYGQETGENLNLWSDRTASGTGIAANDGKRVIESLDTLLEWCQSDPVDTWELSRNDAVQSIQGNRNVFIDYPELLWLLLEREIPDMDTPSDYAHSLHRVVTALAEPAEGGTVSVTGHRVSAEPAPGWEILDWQLTPEDSAVISREGNSFFLTDLKTDCCLRVIFALTDPCALGHDWDEGTVLTLPNCTNAGEKCWICRRCGAERSEEIPALGHLWSSKSVSPSCTEPGYTQAFCSRCGVLGRKENLIPPLGHSWDDGTVVRQPSQSAPGIMRYRCLRCSVARDEEIPFRFVDVQNEKAYYFYPVYWALACKPPITTGTDATHFSPNLSCTRAQVVTFLWRAAGRPKPSSSQSGFTDVIPGSYYEKAVIWAVEEGVTNGVGGNRFGSDENCTRAQVLTFLWRSRGCPIPDLDHLPFVDVQPNAYYAPAVAWAVSTGITKGTSETRFSPKQVCNRAQVISFLFRAKSD
ncbi:MAG: S-layer homology domain-containing protein [Oscillospiraceae bacterium]|nr:S-layer homology domain-containing protein [Oscillospiraceae bacterium]